jgi:hypothetical protein
MARSLRVWGVALIAFAVAGIGAAVLLRGGFALGGASSSDGSRVAPVATSSPSAYVDPAAPTFGVVTSWRIEVGGNAATVFLPLASSAGRAAARYPLVVLRPESGVDPSQYGQLAHDVGAYGLAVVVAPSAAPAELGAIRVWARTLAARPAEPAYGLVDDTAPVVLSAGGTRLLATQLVARESAVLEGLAPLELTDEGVQGPRSGSMIPSAREQRIAAIARWPAWWALARSADPRTVATLRRVEGSLPVGLSVRDPVR